MAKLVAFGEIMGRFAPEGFLTLKQVIPGRMNLTFGGGEANVTASYCALGGCASFVSALPDNDLTDACLAALRGWGVCTADVLRRPEGRFGLYFLETGANQRPSRVIYDRAGSTISETPPTAYPWDAILRGADWFHVTGITPAISAAAADATLCAVKAARDAGITVSCDLNFRKKLWRWDASLAPRELAERTMREIMPFVDVVIGNEEDAEQVLSIHAGDTDVNAGRLAIDRYPMVAEQIAMQFPNVDKVAITLRESVSASHNNWGAMLYDVSAKAAHFAPLRNGVYAPYEIHNIVDRVGGGDAFAAGLIFAMTTPELRENATAIAFAVASSCLAHSIAGDFNTSTRAEVETLMKGSGSGRVDR